MFQKKKAKAPDDPPVCLLDDADALELGLITRLFKEQGLPFLQRERQASGGLFRIATGFSPFGTEIWVRSSDLERARALLDGVSFRAEEDGWAGEEAVCLVEAADAAEREAAEGLLTAAGIPFTLRDSAGSGAAAPVGCGVDLYVRPADFEKARGLLEESGLREGTAPDGLA